MTTQAPSRPMGALGRMGVVAALHAAALYAIAAGLGVVPSPAPYKALVTQFLTENPEPVEPLPIVPGPVLDKPVVHLPLPDAPPADSEPPPTQATTEITTIPPDQTLAGEPATEFIGVRPDSRYPLTQPAYPAVDLRAGREGSAEIEVYVLPTGRIGDARIVRSSGSPTLDESALTEARRRWRLLPAMRAGEPIAQWHRLKVTFNLRNR